MIRIFVAFPIINEWSDSFLQVPTNNSRIENIRWTPKDNLHITLFFIGEIEEDNLQEVKRILKDLFQTQKSFNLAFDSIELKGKKNSMLWARFKNSNSFSDISDNIYENVKHLMTIKKTHDDPIPHCTLARLKPNADISLIDMRIDLNEKMLKIDHAELWKTVQTKEGVKYESLQRYLMND